MLSPDYRFEDVTAVDAAFLEEHGYRFVLFDYDQTLASHSETRLEPRVEEYLDTLPDEVDAAVLSNRLRDSPEDAAVIEERYDIEVLEYSPRKPFPRGYQDALAEYGHEADAALMVGDLLTADIAGAELAGMDAALVDPIAPEEDPLYVRASRRLEQIIDGLL